jgi:hypothetical protein
MFVRFARIRRFFAEGVPASAQEESFFWDARAAGLTARTDQQRHLTQLQS